MSHVKKPASTLIELGSSDPKGLITEHGGWTSHTFILAREINIPASTGRDFREGMAW
jgi:phosphoenolpyruvate-protein kinase (PTS system EI component)